MLTQCRQNADNVKMKAMKVMKGKLGNAMADQMSKTSLTDSLSNLDPKD